MGLIPWNDKPRQRDEGPDSPLAAFRSEMDRLVDTFFREPLAGLDSRFGLQRNWAPTIDMTEDDAEVVVRAEVPGIEPEDIEITVSAGQLVLAGEKKESSRESGKDFVHAEARYGAFRRTIPLPEAADPEQVDAEYANGVLVIRLKKSPTTPAKRVEVKCKES